MTRFRNLGLALGMVRQIRGRSQAEVSRQARIGKSQLSKYERGKELPKLESLEKLLVALEVGTFEFFYILHMVDQAQHGLSGRENDVFLLYGQVFMVRLRDRAANTPANERRTTGCP